jgi:hypothetical protein
MNNVVVARFAGMRKARAWTVMPTSDDRIIIQADGAIGIFDWRSGEGRVCTKGGYFPILGLRRCIFFRPISFAHVCKHALA